MYLESLRKTREMDIDLVLPGHGDPIDDHRSLIDERFKLHDRRAEKIYGLIAERPRSAYEIAQALWGNIAVTQAYLTLSEVLGHTDLLLNAGRVAGGRAGRRRDVRGRRLAPVTSDICPWAVVPRTRARAYEVDGAAWLPTPASLAGIAVLASLAAPARRLGAGRAQRTHGPDPATGEPRRPRRPRPPRAPVDWCANTDPARQPVR